MYIVLENKMLSALGLSPFSFLLIPAKKNAYHKLSSFVCMGLRENDKQDCSNIDIFSHFDPLNKECCISEI